MDLKIFILDGYGQYVWPAFIFAFLCCFSLYFKTKKELKKQEKLFLLEYKELFILETKTIKEEKIPKGILSDNLTY